MPNNFTKFDWSRGINVIDQPNMLPDNEVVKTRNLFPWGPRGLLSSRPNTNIDMMLASTGAIGGITYPVTANSLPMSHGFIEYPSIADPYHSTSFHSFSFIANWTSSPNEIYIGATGDSGSYTIPYFNAMTPYGRWRRGSLSQMPVCVNYCNQQLWFSNTRGWVAGDVPDSYAFLYYADSWHDPIFVRNSLIGTNNSDIVPAGACTYRERLVMWNLKAGYEDCILFTDNNDMTIGNDALSQLKAPDGSPLGRYLQIGMDNTPVVSCIRVQLSAATSLSQEGLLVLKTNGAYLVTGEPNQSNETTYPDGNPPMQVIRFNVDASCLSHHTVVQTPYGIIWCGNDDVWAFVTGQIPFRIGTKLNPLIRACALGGYGFMAHAAYYGGSYRLSLPTIPNTPGQTSIADKHEQYWLELRNGMPPSFQESAWYGPQVYGDGSRLGCLAIDTRPTKRAYMYITKTVDYGSTHSINSVRMDANRTGEDVFAFSMNVPLYARTDNYPLAEYTSKDYDMGDSMVDKVYTGTELSIQTAHDVMMQVVSDMNTGEDSSLITDIIQPNAVQSYVRSLAYCPDGQRPIGPCITIDMNQLPGFLIVAGVNDGIKFRESSGGWKNHHITAGRYATLKDLLDAIVLLMTEKSHNGWTYTHNAATPRTAMLRITSSDGNWEFDPTPSDVAALLTTIGFTQDTYTAAVDQTAMTDVGNAPAYPFDIESAILRTFIIPRRPAV